MDDGGPRFKVWAEVPLWDVCGGVVTLWSPDSGRVIWIDRTGRETKFVEVTRTSSPIQPHDIQAYLRWMARVELGPDFEGAGINFVGMAREHRNRFAERQPGATDIRCEAATVAWLRLFGTSKDPLGRGQVWQRVPQEGSAQKYRFPDQFTPAAFTGEGAFGLLESPEGYQQLAWWSRSFQP